MQSKEQGILELFGGFGRMLGPSLLGFVFANWRHFLPFPTFPQLSLHGIWAKGNLAGGIRRDWPDDFVLDFLLDPAGPIENSQGN
jgi:hypothetical protein